VTAEDLERFPPVPLGDADAARAALDRVTAPAPAGAAEAPKKRGGILGDLLFYAALAVFVLGVFLLRGSRDGAPVTFAGFSAMRVLTSSMEDVIPQGSLIITRQVDPGALEIGDDITYMSGPETSVTHRIVAITENYAGTGQRAFTTQGVMNPSPDSLLVPAANVVGKVIYHNLALGKALFFVREHWTWLLLLAGLFAGLFRCLRIIFSKSDTDDPRTSVPAGTTTQ